MEEYQLQRPVPLPDSNQSGKLGAVGVGQTRRASSLDYKEIFGAVSACSIPVLDLPPAEDGLRFRHCSAMDYLDIFGGDDGCDFTVSYDELFASQVSGGMEAAPPPSAPGGDNDRGLRSIETSSPIENCNDLAGSSSNDIEKAVGDGNDDNTTRLSGSDDNSGNASNLVYEVKAKDPIHSDHGSNDLAQSADTSDDHVESKSDNSQSLLTNSIEKKVSTNTQSVNSEDFRENREHLPSSSQSSENEKLLNPSGGRHSRSSSTNSFSSLDQIYSSNTFLKVTDINLRTRPSKGLPPRRAPPARPPPARPPPKSDSNERTDHGAATSAMSYPSSEAPSFDAAASVAAMQEAMVVAQARLRSAKMSLERKRDGLQNRRKHSLSGDLSSMKRDDCEIEQEKVGEWKVEEQFFELIQGGKKFMNIPKDEMKQGENSEQTKDLKANEAVVDCLEKNQEEEGDHEVPARIELETKWRASKEAFICELGDRNHLQGSSILHKQRASKISEHLETTVEEMKMSHYLEDDELRAKPEVLSKANVVDETEGPGKAEKKLPQEEPVLISLPHSDVCSLTSDEFPQETDVSGEGAGEEIERGDQCHVAFGKGEHLENGGGQVCGDCDDRGNDLSVKKVEREQVIKSGVEEEGDEEAERVRKKVEEDNRRERLMLEEEDRLRRQLEEEEKRERTKLEAEERERRRIEEERERERRLQEEKEEREKRRPEQEESVKERPVVDEGEGMMRRKSGEVEEREGSKVEEDRSGSSEKVELEGRKQEERVRGRWKIEEERLKFRKLEGTMEGQEKQKDKRRTEKEIERERRKIEEESEMDEKERERRMLEEEREREREREKDRQAAERAAQEANERAFAEARERAEKAAARIRAERAAAQKAAAEKAAQEGRVLGDKSSTTPAPSRSEKAGGSEVGESAIRSRARMERHQRTVERAARALAEKNMRDVITQREQTERSRLAEALDAEIRRWSSGKEGNLRALLSTLQYILGPESGWQPVPLTEVLTAQAVKKAYRKATLCVHPDKLQQRGASIQHKYICEKVFDLLKEAWSRFNSEER